MVTLLLSIIQNDQIMQVIGYVLTAVEILLVLVRILYGFAPEGSKFQKFLYFVFRGMTGAKKVLQNPVTGDNEQLGEETEKPAQDEENGAKTEGENNGD